MPDGSSGLSLSEMGVAATKKTAGVVKKVAGPAGQQVKQQLGGTFIPGQSVQLPSSNPPSEVSPKQAGGFDLGSMFGENNPFGNTKSAQTTSHQMQNPQVAAQLEQQKAKDQQQVEMLRKKLHDIYFEKFQREAEGKGADKQQEERKREEVQQQEEEQKKQQKEQQMESIQMSESPQKGTQGQKKKSGFSLMKLLKPKMGSHEGSAGKG